MLKKTGIMSLTYTIQEGLGDQAPAFELLDVVSGETYSYAALAGDKGTAVMFICNHCPYVVHVREKLVEIANEYQAKGIGFVAISSNSVETHPADGPDQMKELAETLLFPFPYLFDADQSVAKAYQAACTPDFFIYDAEASCVYRGQLDSSRPGGTEPVTGVDMKRALDALLNGEGALKEQRPSMGCNIKWAPGNEPAYFG